MDLDKENERMHYRMGLLAVGLVFAAPALAAAQITGGVMSIRGAEMS